jgi:hypothetical protein
VNTRGSSGSNALSCVRRDANVMGSLSFQLFLK